MTKNNNGNYKLKGWKEVKIIENEPICNIYFHVFDLVPFLLILDIFHTMSFCFVLLLLILSLLLLLLLLLLLVLLLLLF